MFPYRTTPKLSIKWLPWQVSQPNVDTWWCYDMITLSTLLDLCEENPYTSYQLMHLINQWVSARKTYSTANALELRLSCTNPLKWPVMRWALILLLLAWTSYWINSQVANTPQTANILLSQHLTSTYIFFNATNITFAAFSVRKMGVRLYSIASKLLS